MKGANDETETALVLLSMSVVLIPARARLQQKTPEVVPAINVGTVAPDFTLEDTKGTKVNLGEQVKQQPVVLVFYRGYW